MNLFVISEQNLDGQFASRTHILEFCRSMAKLTHVTFLSYTARQIIIDTLNGNLEFVVIEEKPVKFPINNLAYLFSTIKIYFTLRKISRSKPVDLIYIRAIPFGLGPLWFARRHGIPTILEINGVWDAEQKLAFSYLPAWNRSLAKLIARIRNRTMNYACHLADLLIAVTPNISTYLQSKGITQKKIVIASNGVNTDHFQPFDHIECRRHLGMPADSFIAGYVGSLSAWQGVEDLIEASAIFREEHPNMLKTLIIGDGPQRQLLEELCKAKSLTDTVTFLGSKPYHEIPRQMSACDVLVAPKKPLSSGYSPLKVYEYLACGRPVVVSDVIGLEFVAQNELGVSFEAGDARQLADKLEDLYEMPIEIREKMGQRAREYVKQHHSWDSVTTLILDNARQHFAIE